MSEERVDDDWFERALRDDETSDDAETAPEDGDDEPEGAPEENGNRSTIERDGPAGASETPATELDDEFPLEADADVELETDPDEDDESLFDEDFGSALGNVELPDVGDEPEGFSNLDFGLEGSAGETDFDEEVESDLPRIDLGIDGLDRMIQGGVPERSLMVAMGSAGTGKTTFGLQFLNQGLERGENAVFITLEETRERVIKSAVEKGYAFDEYDRDGSLAVVDIDPVEMANGLASIRSELPALIEDFGASRLVLDSVSLLEMMYEDRAKRRNEIYDFTRSLKSAGVTAMLTSEASDDSPYVSRYGIVEYLTDAVFVLQYVRPDDFRETRLAIEIQKIRDANHSREKKPYEITNEGISVYQQANLF